MWWVVREGAVFDSCCCAKNFFFQTVKLTVERSYSFESKIRRSFVAKWMKYIHFILQFILPIVSKKKDKRKSPGSATITDRRPSQTPRGRGN